MTYSPNPDAILKSDKKGEPASPKSSFVGRVLDSIARTAAGIDKKVQDVLVSLEDKIDGNKEELASSIKAVDKTATAALHSYIPLSEALNETAKDILTQGEKITNLENHYVSLAACVQELEGGVKKTVEGAAKISLENTANSVEYLEDKLSDMSDEVKALVEDKASELKQEATDIANAVVHEATKPIKRSLWIPILIGTQVVFDLAAITYVVLERLSVF